MWCAGEYSVPTFQPDYSIEEDDEASDSDDGTSYVTLSPSLLISAFYLLHSSFFLLPFPFLLLPSTFFLLFPSPIWTLITHTTCTSYLTLRPNSFHFRYFYTMRVIFSYLKSVYSKVVIFHRSHVYRNTDFRWFGND